MIPRVIERNLQAHAVSHLSVAFPGKKFSILRSIIVDLLTDKNLATGLAKSPRIIIATGGTIVSRNPRRNQTTHMTFCGGGRGENRGSGYARLNHEGACHGPGVRSVVIGLHGVPNCSSRQSGLPLWIVPVHVTS